MKQVIIFSILLIVLYTNGQSQDKSIKYSLQVGDIDFDSNIDDPNFKLCDETSVLQYFNFEKGLLFKGEKKKINDHFKEGLKNREPNDESGFLTIRFLINCHGKTGRYRIQGMDNKYNEKKFSENLAKLFLSLTKELDGWLIGKKEGKTFDYYQYLTFKIENGILVEILP